MQQGHRQATVERGCSDPGHYLIVAQDTCFFNYTSHPAMEGPGRIQGNIRGIAMHSAMLFGETGQPPGLPDQQYRSRDGAVDYDGIESNKWLDGLNATRKQLKDCDKHIVLVQDREADGFRFIKPATTTPQPDPASDPTPANPSISVLVPLHQPGNLQLAAGAQPVRRSFARIVWPDNSRRGKRNIRSLLTGAAYK